MFNIFSSNPAQKLRKRFNAKLEEAMHAQRSGNIRKYSELSEEAEALRLELEDLEKQNEKV